MEDLVALAERQGFRVKRTKKGVLIYGKKPGTGMVLVHLTCSDHRAVKNAKSGLKRLGVEFDR
jgi:hypothetical protein